MKIKALFISACLIIISGCGGGSSDSGGDVEVTAPGDMLPANFIGTYSGTLNVTASAAGLTETDSFPITITVNADGTVRFDGDDPDETFTAGISNTGAFTGSVTIQEDPCSGTVSLSGSVDGTTASGTATGDGSCTQNGLKIDVELDGDFSARK